MKEKSFTMTQKLSAQAELSRWTSFTKQVKVWGISRWQPQSIKTQGWWGGFFCDGWPNPHPFPTLYLKTGMGPSTRLCQPPEILRFSLSCSYYCLPRQLEMRFSLANTLSSCSSKRVAPQYICCFRVHNLQMWRESLTCPWSRDQGQSLPPSFLFKEKTLCLLRGSDNC